MSSACLLDHMENTLRATTSCASICLWMEICVGYLHEMAPNTTIKKMPENSSTEKILLNESVWFCEWIEIRSGSASSSSFPSVRNLRASRWLRLMTSSYKWLSFAVTYTVYTVDYTERERRNEELLGIDCDLNRIIIKKILQISNKFQLNRKWNTHT